MAVFLVAGSWSGPWVRGCDKTRPSPSQAPGLLSRQNQIVTRQLIEGNARCEPGSRRSAQQLTRLQMRRLRHGPCPAARAGSPFQEWPLWSGLPRFCARTWGRVPVGGTVAHVTHAPEVLAPRTLPARCP